MPTIRQKRAAKLIVENLQADKPLNKQEIVVSSGYSKITADRHSKTILDSKGVNEELKNYGFDSNKAKEIVGEILVAGESDIVKLKAADTIFKVNGDYAPEKHVSINLEAQMTPELRELANELLHRQSNT